MKSKLVFVDEMSLQDLSSLLAFHPTVSRVHSFLSCLVYFT